MKNIPYCIQKVMFFKVNVWSHLPGLEPILFKGFQSNVSNIGNLLLVVKYGFPGFYTIEKKLHMQQHLSSIAKIMAKMRRAVSTLPRITEIKMVDHSNVLLGCSGLNKEPI